MTGAHERASERASLEDWTGTTWSGLSRRTDWAYDYLFKRDGDEGPTAHVDGRAIGPTRVLRFLSGTSIVALGIGESDDEAAAHVFVDGRAVTLRELIAVHGGALPTAEQLELLREQSRVTGRWPFHAPGTHCYACGRRFGGPRVRKDT